MAAGTGIILKTTLVRCEPSWTEAARHRGRATTPCPLRSIRRLRLVRDGRRNRNLPVEISKDVDLADENQIAEGRRVADDRHRAESTASRIGSYRRGIR
jgi:hypothetical protein